MEEYSSIANKDPRQFVKNDTYKESQKRTWEICNAVNEEMIKDGKERTRRLVSLFEANEVAKRIAGFKKRGGVVINGGLVDGDMKPDVVSEWVSTSQMFPQMVFGRHNRIGNPAYS